MPRLFAFFGRAHATRALAMSSPTLPAATPPTTELKTGAVIRRLLRDYVSGQWGLLVLAIFCMLLASARWAAPFPSW